MAQSEARQKQKSDYEKKRVIKNFSLLKERDKHLIEYLETVDNVGNLIRDLLNQHLNFEASLKNEG